MWWALPQGWSKNSSHPGGVWSRAATPLNREEPNMVTQSSRWDAYWVSPWEKFQA